MLPIFVDQLCAIIFSQLRSSVSPYSVLKAAQPRILQTILIKEDYGWLPQVMQP